MTHRTKEPTLADLQKQLSIVESEIRNMESSRLSPEQETEAVLQGKPVKEFDDKKLAGLWRKHEVLHQAVRVKEQSEAAENRAKQRSRKIELMKQHREYAVEAHKHLRDFVSVAMTDAEYVRACREEGIDLADLFFPFSLKPVMDLNPEKMLSLWEVEHADLLTERGNSTAQEKPQTEILSLPDAEVTDSKILAGLRMDD